MIKLISLFYLLPLSLFSVEGWIPAELKEAIDSFPCERHSMEIFFETNVPVQVECAYPFLAGEDLLTEHVNQQLQQESKNRFDNYVKGELLSEEIWEEGNALMHEFFLAYRTQNLVSVYGSDFQGRGCHGCTYYEGKTFWKKEDTVIELHLDDLFVKGSEYRQFLVAYCESQLKASGYGYYSSLPEMPPELCPDDLDIFVITDKGLTIIFRAYRIGGWADGPDALTIPWIHLKEYIQSDGPLKEIAVSFPKK